MDAKQPRSASATAIWIGDCVTLTSNAAAPMPKKNTVIILRRPQWSPSLPEGRDPMPKKKNAATL
jgi:hypothetical protein